MLLWMLWIWLSLGPHHLVWFNGWHADCWWYVGRLLFWKGLNFIILSFQLKTQTSDFLFSPISIFCSQVVCFLLPFLVKYAPALLPATLHPSGQTVIGWAGIWYKACDLVLFGRTLSIFSSNDFRWLMIANKSRGRIRYWHESGGPRSNTDSIPPRPHYSHLFKGLLKHYIDHEKSYLS